MWSVTMRLLHTVQKLVNSATEASGPAADCAALGRTNYGNHVIARTNRTQSDESVTFFDMNLIHDMRQAPDVNTLPETDAVTDVGATTDVDIGRDICTISNVDAVVY